MKPKRCLLIGAPVDSGKRRQGCMMGPDAYRTAKLAETVAALGHEVSDLGNISPATIRQVSNSNKQVYALPETVAWAEAIAAAGQEAAMHGFPIFLGGDHSLSLGSVAGMAAHASSQSRPLFILWLDAHTDLHTPLTSGSGNLHGTPLGYISGAAGFDAFPPMPKPVPAHQICMIGLRSVDAAEKAMLQDSEMTAVDMRTIDEQGIARPLAEFLGRVAAASGLLHVSLDVDFLDPSIAPAVGTTVPGGATFREAHLVMEMLGDSGLVSSLDLVELNPFLDDRGRTASLMVDLTASLLGRRVFDRPTQSFNARITGLENQS
ncbi:arginase [Algicella marina]|uniref:Arginase n=1 Tax=Algicella marina TaxID=2683284 RepID=A0A6P1T6C4_9RHOB|nr:arginase [Algicella marina]QHQ37361.1 arginase [Algicella marina]